MTEPSKNRIPPQTPDRGGPDGLFYPSEHAILCDWFGLARPGSCAAIDLFNRPREAPGIWPVLGKYGDRELALKNAVARIALGSIQRELPSLIYHDAESGRYLSARRFYPVRLAPEFLFQINWADTAPGVSWPESYHLTLIPGYDRWVVAMSHDSPEVWGRTDLAIGWFGAHERRREGARRVISDWWRAHGDGSEEARWTAVWKEGLVSAEEADAWADEVWSPAKPRDYEPPPSVQDMDFDYDFRPRYWPLDNAVPVPRGGEDLPPLLPGEVEIARIVLRSATRNVVSVRDLVAVRSPFCPQLKHIYERRAWEWYQEKLGAEEVP